LRFSVAPLYTYVVSHTCAAAATPTTVTPCGDAELHGELARHAAAVGFDWVTLASPSLVYASVVYNTCVKKEKR